MRCAAARNLERHSSVKASLAAGACDERGACLRSLPAQLARGCARAIGRRRLLLRPARAERERRENDDGEAFGTHDSRTIAAMAAGVSLFCCFKRQRRGAVARLSRSLEQAVRMLQCGDDGLVAGGH